MSSLRRASAIAVVAVFLLGGTAWAVPTIDFNIFEPTTGSVVFLGGPTPLMGANISVDFVTGTDTPLNAGSFACIDCMLNFETGNFIGATPTSWIFAGGFGSSFLTITGSVDTDGNGTADIGPSLLLVGSFIGPQISVDLIPGSPLASAFSFGMFLDIKNQDLAAFFGLPMIPYEGDFLLSWGGIGDPGTPIFATPRNGLVRNTFVAEPGTLLLLGAGLLALARRRGKAA